MPKELHKKLAKSAKRLGLHPGSDSYEAYVYGTMNKIESENKDKKKRGVIRSTRYNTK